MGIDQKKGLSGVLAVEAGDCLTTARVCVGGGAGGEIGDPGKSTATPPQPTSKK